MSISGISSAAVAATHTPSAAKPNNGQPASSGTAAAASAVAPAPAAAATDSDGDRDGSGRLNVKA